MEIDNSTPESLEREKIKVTDTTLYANMLSELFKVSAEING